MADSAPRPRGGAHAAAVALDHGLADLALERGELLGHGGRCLVQRVGRGGERPLLGETSRRDAQAAGIDHAVQLTDPKRNRLLALYRMAHSQNVVDANCSRRPRCPRHRDLGRQLRRDSRRWGALPAAAVPVLRFTLIGHPGFVCRSAARACRGASCSASALRSASSSFGLLFVSIDEGLPAWPGVAAAPAPGDLQSSASRRSRSANGARGAQESQERLVAGLW